MKRLLQAVQTPDDGIAFGIADDMQGSFHDHSLPQGRIRFLSPWISNLHRHQRLSPARQHPISTFYNKSAVKSEGETMGNLNNALQELRAERKQAQLQVEEVGSGDCSDRVTERYGNTAKSETNPQETTSAPTRIISAASRRKMALAQQARWAKIRKESQPMAAAKTMASAPVKRTMSLASRRKDCGVSAGAVGEAEERVRRRRRRAAVACCE